MNEVSITSISITGYGGQAVPNLLFRPGGTIKGVGVLLPGLRYTCDMPLLYYTTQILLAQHCEVLQLHTDYTTPKYQSASHAEQAEWLASDARAAVQAGSKERKLPLVLVGKSIGTLGLTYLTTMWERAITIWQTPLLRQPRLVQTAMRLQAPALFIGGTGDALFDKFALSDIQQSCGAQAIVIEGADHSVEIPGQPLRSLEVMQEVMRGTEEFLVKALG